MASSSEVDRRLLLDVGLTTGATPALADLRHSVRHALVNADDNCVEDAELLVTELVSNAFDHGRPPMHLRLCLLPNAPTVHIEVEDGDRLHLPLLGTSRLGGERGRGLVLVEQLASDWGCTVEVESKIVWAQMNCRMLSVV
ncbi:hypothetical protein GCM10011609_32880 [Lentzea pudingi]|uniref:Histidine kinase/HSP90-like ATPase domain-containing protein n=1 Tax=Lentzea pudingi TaxID=1789439 RepID=A0ABQ2HVH9_9PSEU|nr:ATP-binding protein [Lentzea pudingi]GGM92828.1 hypothetical protein GCM10011609_32880 [Lentzea pudingi]